MSLKQKQDLVLSKPEGVVIRGNRTYYLRKRQQRDETGLDPQGKSRLVGGEKQMGVQNRGDLSETNLALIKR